MAKQMLFPLGQVVATLGAMRTITESKQHTGEFLARHQTGDWGECDPEDARENDRSVKHGYRILSVYKTRKGETIWIITEADRSSTCLLLPDDY